MRDLEHPSITHVNRTGHTSEEWRALQRKSLAQNRYMEDVYGEPINLGDTYYEDSHGQLIHEKSLAIYAIEHCGLTENTR